MTVRDRIKSAAEADPELSQVALAERFGVSTSTVRSVLGATRRGLQCAEKAAMARQGWTEGVPLGVLAAKLEVSVVALRQYVVRNGLRRGAP